MIHFTTESFPKKDGDLDGEEVEIKGLMPNVLDAITELDFLVTWHKVQNGAGGEEEVPYPKAGLDEVFD